MLSNFFRPARFTLAIVTLCIFDAAFMFGQSKPNFSGTWNQIQPPTGSTSSHVEKIQHREPDLKLIIETKTYAGMIRSGLYLDHAYSINGQEEVKKANDGTIRTVSVHWEGNTLVFLRTEQDGADIITTREVWSLSDDGKTLTKTRHITSPGGVEDEKSVFEKQ